MTGCVMNLVGRVMIAPTPPDTLPCCLDDSPGACGGSVLWAPLLYEGIHVVPVVQTNSTDFSVGRARFMNTLVVRICRHQPLCGGRHS